MQFLTDFADQAVMLPVAAVVAIGLALSAWWRGLFAWIVAVVGMLGTMSLLKYIFYTCSVPLAVTGIHSPSGHTAASAAIYGGGLLLLLRGRLPAPVLAAIPLALAVVFGVTRLAVHAHDVAEVLVGGAVGLATAAVLAALAGPRPPLRVWPTAIGALIIVVCLHGVRLQAETTIHRFVLFQWLPLPAVCRV